MNLHISFRIFTQVLLLFLGLGGSGCSSYHTGTPTEGRPFHSLAILPIRNQSMAPQMQALLGRQVARILMQEHGFRIVSSPRHADATLEITLKDYDRSPNATHENDAVVARSFELTLQATCTLSDPESGTVHFRDQPVEASVYAFSDRGFQPSEYSAMPALGLQLARSIAIMVATPWLDSSQPAAEKPSQPLIPAPRP